MLNQKSDTLSKVKIEIIDTVIGYEETKRQRTKQLASRRLLAARRAIEERQEAKRLANDINENTWFEDI